MLHITFGYLFLCYRKLLLSKKQRRGYHEGVLTGKALMQTVAQRRALRSADTLTSWSEVKAALLSPHESVRDKAASLAGAHRRTLLSCRIELGCPLSSPPVVMPRPLHPGEGGAPRKKKPAHIDLGFTDRGEPREFEGDEDSVSYVRYLGNFNGLGTVASHLETSREVVEMLYESGLPGRTVWRGKTLEDLHEMAAVHAVEREERGAARMGRDMAQEVNSGLLCSARRDACGIGTRKLKLRLNKLSKAGDKEAQLVRTLLEVEDKNIVAKDTSYYYRDKVYDQKSALLRSATDLLDELGWRYGYTGKTGKNAMYLVYVFLPGGAQVSWHMNDSWVPDEVPPIDCEWDGQEASTLPKLLAHVQSRFQDILLEKVSKRKTA